MDETSQLCPYEFLAVENRNFWVTGTQWSLNRLHWLIRIIKLNYGFSILKFWNIRKKHFHASYQWVMAILFKKNNKNLVDENSRILVTVHAGGLSGDHVDGRPICGLISRSVRVHGRRAQSSTGHSRNSSYRRDKLAAVWGKRKVTHLLSMSVKVNC